MSLIGPIAGFRALVEMKANPNVRGRGIAIAGISTGAVATVFWIVVAVWWHFNARVPMLHGPEAAFIAGFAGDVAGFKAQFHGDGAIAPDVEAAEFLGNLSRRYGGFVESTQSAVTPSGPPPSGSTDFRLGYSLTFVNGRVECEAVFTTFGKANVVPSLLFKWKWIRVVDPLRGDLVYPVAAEPDARAKPQAATRPSPKP